jgi:hypothetical protein
MKKPNILKLKLVAAAMPLVFLIGCSSSVNKDPKEMKNSIPKGKYGYDVAFFHEKKIETIELKDDQSKACLLIIPVSGTRHDKHCGGRLWHQLRMDQLQVY